MQTKTEDGFTLLLAALVRKAYEDYRDGYTHSNRPDAAAFLTSAGLLSPDGLDPRFKEYLRQGRKKRHDDSTIRHSPGLETRHVAQRCGSRPNGTRRHNSAVDHAPSGSKRS